MTRGDAKMIAEELYKLMQKDNINDEYLTKEEASAIYKIPTSHFEHYGYKYPRVKLGKSYKYSKLGLDRVIKGVI